VADVGGVVLADFRGKSQGGAEQRCPQFGDLS
jgi:hypothetical protein